MKYYINFFYFSFRELGIDLLPRIGPFEVVHVNSADSAIPSSVSAYALFQTFYQIGGTNLVVNVYERFRIMKKYVAAIHDWVDQITNIFVDEPIIAGIDLLYHSTWSNKHQQLIVIY